MYFSFEFQLLSIYSRPKAFYLFKQGGWIDLSMNFEASPGWVGNHQIDPQESDYSEEEVLQDK